MQGWTLCVRPFFVRKEKRVDPKVHASSHNSVI